MKTKITFLFFLVFTLTQFGQSNTCNSVVNDMFDEAGAIPTEWTEYNTTGNVTVDSGQLKFDFNATLPAAYRTFTAVSENVIFSFDVSASKTYSRCHVNLISATGKYLSTIDVGAKSSSIKFATTMSEGVPSSFSDGSSKITLIKNTIYTLSASVNFTTQTVDYYADGALIMLDVPFLETANDVTKVDIQSLFMYNNNGNFNFDNITVSISNEGRLLLSNAVRNSESILNAAAIGTEGGEYAQSDYDIFQTAINTAIEVENNCAANQSELSKSLEDLNTALTNFEASSVPFVQSVSINALDTKQKVLMMGGDMVRNAHNIQEAPNKEEIVDWLIKDIPFNTYRVKYDKTQELVEGNKKLDSVYGDMILTMKMMLKVNPELKFFAHMRSDYHGYGQGNKNNLPTFIYDYEYVSATDSFLGTKYFDAVKYGLFLADYVAYMSDNGVPITYLATSKEWSVVTAEIAKTTIETLISTLAERGVAMPLIIDPGSWSLSKGVSTVNAYVAKDVNKYVYGYSSHNYNGGDTTTWTDFGDAVKSAGKLSFDDESSHGGGGQTTEAEVPITKVLFQYTDRANMYAGGIQGECFFDLSVKANNFNKYFARPIVYTASQNGRRMRSYYIMKKFAENAVDATYVSQTLNNFEDVVSMAFLKDDKMVFWIVNSSETAYSDFSININNLGLKAGMNIQQIYWDDTALITGNENSIEANSDNQFKANIAPLSISYFMIDPKAALSTENHQISNVNIYPNPVADKLVVSDPDAVFNQFTVYNINGQVIKSGEISSEKVEINTSKLSKGFYFLKLEGIKTSETHKIIKK